MKRLAAIALVALLPLLAGCAPKSSDTTAAAPDTTATAAPATTDTAAAPAALLAKSLYDDGPRAVEGAINPEQAEAGQKLFTTKGCTACHAYGKKMTGPDLKGVTQRRTALWMENQILHPDVMTRTDPISHGLMVENKNLQMLKLPLTQAEAQSLIAYFRKLDAGK
jgi:cytochrome c5